MKFLTCAIFVLFAAVAAVSQQLPDVYATATGHTFKRSDLSAATQAAVSELPSSIANARTRLLAQMTNEALLNAEAKARGVTFENLIKDIGSTAAEPTEAQIKTVYQANLAALDNKPLDQVRKPIVAFLKREAGGKAIQAFIEGLRAKHKVTPLKDVNAAGLKPADGLVSVGTVTISAEQFEAENKLALYEAAAEVSDLVLAELDEIIFSSLIIDEAKSLNIDASSLMAREITDKLKNFSDDERVGLEEALRKKLYSKYKVNILYKEPEPIVESISVDDDPAQGPAAAPVTIVMFSDFQCPACSAAHPLLKKAMAEYPGKIRFVVRDFPLMNIHENAFNAALAANAANESGKFFEYIDILYRNQTALDVASLRKYAADIGLQPAQFELIFNSEKTAAEVRKDMADGDRYGISSTPTVFVNGVRVRRLSTDGFRKAIDRALLK